MSNDAKVVRDCWASVVRPGTQDALETCTLSIEECRALLHALVDGKECMLSTIHSQYFKIRMKSCEPTIEFWDKYHAEWCDLLTNFDEWISWSVVGDNND